MVWSHDEQIRCFFLPRVGNDVKPRATYLHKLQETLVLRQVHLTHPLLSSKHKTFQ